MCKSLYLNTLKLKYNLNCWFFVGCVDLIIKSIDRTSRQVRILLVYFPQGYLFYIKIAGISKN